MIIQSQNPKRHPFQEKNKYGDGGSTFDSYGYHFAGKGSRLFLIGNCHFSHLLDAAAHYAIHLICLSITPQTQPYHSSIHDVITGTRVFNAQGAGHVYLGRIRNGTSQQKI